MIYSNLFHETPLYIYTNMNQRLLIFLLGIMAYFCLHAQTDSYGQADTPPGVTIAKPYSLRDKVNSYRVFEVSVKNPGSYFISFWILPIYINDKEYASLEVYKDNEKFDLISPVTDGWQLIAPDRNNTIYLSEGKHLIYIASPYKIPLNVEKLYLSETKIIKNADSERYDKFMASCIDPTPIDFIEEVKLFQSSNTLTQGELNNVPLRYTFQSFEEFDEGDTLKIQSVGNIEHCVDLVFIGSPKYTAVLPPIRPWGDSENLSENDLPVVTPGLEPATIEEKCGLTWTAGCMKNESNSFSIYGKYETNKIIQIPKTGTYLLRARSLNSGASGTARLEFTTGELKGNWSKVTLNNYYRTVYFTPNNLYTCWVTDINPSQTNPLLCLQLYEGDRIQDYSYERDKFGQQIGLEENETSLQNKLKYPTGFISVNSRYSTSPESLCTIDYNLDNGDQNIYDFIRSIQSRKVVSKENIPLDNNGIDVEVTESDLVIHSDLSGTIQIYDFKGILLFQKEFTAISDSIIIPLSELNISANGIYLVRISNDNESKTIKLRL